MTAPDDRPDRPDEPDEDRAWAELVEAFHATPDDTAERSWPAAEDLGPDEDHVAGQPFGAGTPFDTGQPFDAGPPVDAGSVLSDPAQSRTDPPRRREGAGAGPSEEADHFVPPPPPPIPPGDLVTRLAWAGVLVPPGVVLVAGLTSIGVPTSVMAFLALAFIVGFATLVSRMRGHHPSDPDDGAVL